MATYVKGVETYLPDIKPFTPDYKFLSAVLETRTDKYDRNYKASRTSSEKLCKYTGCRRIRHWQRINSPSYPP